MKVIRENRKLFQQLLSAAKPVAIVAQVRWAQFMVCRLRFEGRVFCVPHPSRRGRVSYEGAAQDIETVFESA